MYLRIEKEKIRSLCITAQDEQKMAHWPKHVPPTEKPPNALHPPLPALTEHVHTTREGVLAFLGEHLVQELGGVVGTGILVPGEQTAAFSCSSIRITAVWEWSSSS